MQPCLVTLDGLVLEIVRKYSTYAIAHASQGETRGIVSSKEKQDRSRNLILQNIAIM